MQLQRDQFAWGDARGKPFRFQRGGNRLEVDAIWTETNRFVKGMTLWHPIRPATLMNTPPPKATRTKKCRGTFLWVILGLVILTRYVWLPDLWRMPEDHRAGFEQRMNFGPQRRMDGARTSSLKPVSELPNDLWRLEIEIRPDDMDRLRGYAWNGWNGGLMERPEVNATVRERGVTYTNVAIHPKGSAGSFRPIDTKPALTLNFSKNAPKQKFHGWNKLSLNNSVQDNSYLCESISRELFNAAGVPAPEAKHATVLLNGKDLGLYVAVEGYGKAFVKKHFSNTSGNLYDGGFCREITESLEVNSGDHPADRSDLKRLAQAASSLPASNRWAKLNQVLDMDRFLSMLAMEVMTCHWDGYSMNRNNYRVFHDLTSDRMVFMPHGMDQMFGAFRSTPTSSIMPSTRGLVARAVMGTPEGRKAYLEKVAMLRTNVFNAEAITDRVMEISRTIRPTLAAYHPSMAEEHDRNAAYLCQRITQRAASIEEQLLRPREGLHFDPSGTAKLAGWSPRTNPNQPGTVEFETTTENGKKQLRIKAKNGGSGSWRTRVTLEGGQYSLEGTARGINLKTGGVGLRVSGIQAGLKRAKDGETIQLSYPFQLGEPMTELELICELRGSDAEVSFDAESLRLVRR